ncbi:MAG: BCAM0308 family protein [Thermodesulfobacteriota bacterium]|nr:MAG: BCAM0308 family protein [Thermodesulfobacteriota bacterium]
MKGPRIVRKKAMNSEKDPYLMKISPEDMAVCKKCGAVYHNKRWSLDADTVKMAFSGKATEVLCPACQKIKDGFAGGFVTIQGGFIKDHSEEILNLVRNKEKRAMHNNPLDRIIEIKKKSGSIEIKTTTDKLAQRIGQMVKKTFNGDIEYKWSSDVKLARVVWTRDAGS